VLECSEIVMTTYLMNVAFTQICIFSDFLKTNSSGKIVLCSVLFRCTLQFSGT
jgi:hypothetical protein